MNKEELKEMIAGLILFGIPMLMVIHGLLQ